MQASGHSGAAARRSRRGRKGGRKAAHFALQISSSASQHARVGLRFRARFAFFVKGDIKHFETALETVHDAYSAL